LLLSRCSTLREAFCNIMEYSPLPISEGERTTLSRDLDLALGNSAFRALFLLEDEEAE
jgi:hypothetical protein